MPVTTESHIRLKVSGSAGKVALFHWLAGTLDPDYPLAPPRLRRRTDCTLLCPVCHGLVYHHPMLSPEQLRAMGKQINESKRLAGHLKVKVRMYNSLCPGRLAPAPVPTGMEVTTCATGAD